MYRISARRRFVATVGLLVGSLLLTSTVSAVSAAGVGSTAVVARTASPVGGQAAGTGVHTITRFSPSSVGHVSGSLLPSTAGAEVSHDVLRRSAESSTVETHGTVRVNDTTTPAATFIVTYHGFSAAQQAAFQAAIDNWSTHLFAPRPITVDASLAPLGDYILGGTDIPDQWHDLGGTMPSQLLYPQSLAKQLAPADAAVQTTTSPDITITFTSSITPSSLAVNWYFGTDGHPPSNGVDFETVTMHELAHGLGFASSLDIGPEGGCGSSDGCWGYGGDFGATLPTVFDANVFDCTSHEWLTPTSPDITRTGPVFTDNSTDLAAELVSQHVCWGGPEGDLVLGHLTSDPPLYPALYAPSDWEPGSSISHLNDPGSLLAYALGAGVALHGNPYDVDALLTDIGWVTSPITSYYLDHGGASGPFGARVQPEYGTVGFARFTVYANGAIVWSAAHGTHGFTGGIFRAFNAIGGVIGMGDPTTEVVPSAGGHSRIEFTIGSIYAGPAGAFSLRHVSADYEGLHADAGSLGMPLSSEAPHGGGGTFAVFQGGRMYYTAALGAHEVHGAVLTEWGRLGGSSGALGYPQSDVRTALGVPTARFSQFKGGNIYWTASLGAHRVTGSILAYYLARSSSAGRYGLPVGNPTKVDSVHVRQNFQHGNIVQNVTTGHVAGNLG